MNCKVILGVNPQAFIEYANMIKYSLEELGHNAEVIETDVNGCPSTEGQLNIVTKAFRPYRQLGRNCDGNRQVLFQSEELWHARDSGVYDCRENGSAWERTLEMYKDNADLPNKVNHNVIWCPYGYSKAFETDLPTVDEDIDILFFGAQIPFRADHWNELSNHPAMKGKKLLHVNNVYGIERDKLIMRSKIVINIKVTPRWSYPPLRALLTQCKKKMFMCHDPNGGRDPFISGKHFLEFKDMNHLAEMSQEWLNNNSRRNEFAVNAYEDIKKYHKFTDHLRTGLAGIL